MTASVQIFANGDPANELNPVTTSIVPPLVKGATWPFQVADSRVSRQFFKSSW